VGRARLKGIPIQDKAGIRITADPTPPRAKIKLNINDSRLMIKILDAIFSYPYHKKYTGKPFFFGCR
jgi:hypothetical protein